MFKRSAVIVAAALVAASLGAPVAHAEVQDSFTLSASKTVVTNAYRTTVAVTVHYTCLMNDWTPEESNLGVNITQIQAKNLVVIGGAGIPGMGMDLDVNPLTCDGADHSVDFTVQANTPSGSPATWKKGKATLQINAGVSAPCDSEGFCPWMGSQAVQVVMVR